MSQLGHSRRDWLRATIGPRPLRPESDPSKHEPEMARWANNDQTAAQQIPLLNNLIGGGEQRLRDGEAQRFRRP